MTAHAVARAAAHKLCAQIVESSITISGDVAEVARIEAAGLIVVVQIRQEQIETKTQVSVESPAVRLTPMEKDLLEAAPEFREEPISVKALAKLAGYRYSSYLRASCNKLILAGLLVRVPGGVKKTSR